MTTLTEDSSPRRNSLPVLFSLTLHAAVVGAILYASCHQTVAVPQASQPISVSMVAPEVQAEPHSAPRSVSQPEPEPEPKPAPLMPVPVVVPQSKPKPRPVKKEAAKHKEQLKPHTEAKQSSPFNDDKNATAFKPATAPKVSPAPATSTSIAASEGPKPISVTKPGYPVRAQTLGIEGSVRVQFDVNEGGEVTNIRIISAEPRNIFERDVRIAMRKWRYQSGAPGKDLTMNIVFKLKGGATIE